MMSRRRAILQTGATALAVLQSGFLGAGLGLGQDEEIPESIRPLLDPAMESRMLRIRDVGQSTYYIVEQLDGEGSGEPVFIREPARGEPIIVEDVRSLPLEVIFGGTGEGAAGEQLSSIDVMGFALPEDDLRAYEPEGEGAASQDIDQKMHDEAVEQEVRKMSSKDAEGTDNGNLACAWAVNRIAKLALGRSIGGGLATANMVKVLKARHVKVKESEAPAGSVIISPTEYRGNRANIGHVGILAGDGTIYSNSSRRARWEKTHTLAAWKRYYGGKGLTVQIYRLDGDYF